MGDYERRDGDEEEEEEEIDESYYKSQKDAVLFAINVSKSMLEKPPSDDKADQDNPVLAALKCAYQVMQQRIISQPKDMMGILLFGTEKSKLLEGASHRIYPHCYLYTPLDVPEAEDVKRLRNLVEAGDDPDETLTPTEEIVPLKDLLFCANQLFVTKAPNFGSRKLFIITDNDDPHSGDQAENEAASVRAKDLNDLDVMIEVFPVTRGDGEFDANKLYSHLVYRDPTAEPLQSDGVNDSKAKDGWTLMKDLVSKINSKQTPKRAYFSNMPLELGPGLQISVKGYNLIQPQKVAKSCYIWLEGDQPQIAVGETERMADDVARRVEKVEIKRAYKFGGEYVYFSPEEQQEIKKFGEPIIRIIGFKDRSLLKFWMSLDKSVFIYPSEEGYVGSTRVFSALWQKLLKSKKIGIAWHISRRNANPKLVALIPSAAQFDEKNDKNKTPYMPTGLWLYPIPFADDVRPAPEIPLVQTTNELADKMHMVVRNLQLPNGTYNPTKYPNPALQWHYRILQALALEDDVPEQPLDATVPKFKTIHKRCGGYIEDWSQAVDEELRRRGEQKAIKREMTGDDESDEPRPKKQRKTATNGSSKAASGEGSFVLADVDLKKRANADQLSKLKVAELRDLLSARQLDPKGLKKDLVDRLEQWVESNV